MMTVCPESSGIEMKKILALPIILITLMCFVSCTMTLKEEDGKLIDTKNGITYLAAPICFEPSRTEDELYAKSSKSKLELYPVSGQSTSNYISELYGGIGGLWYSDEITLPTLETFGANRVYICVEGTITTALGQITDENDINFLINAITNGETCQVPTSGKSYKLKFESDDYPGIYYNLLYILNMTAEDIVKESGESGVYYNYGHYVYDRATQTCVDVGEVLEKYLPYSTSTSAN